MHLDMDVLMHSFEYAAFLTAEALRTALHPFEYAAFLTAEALRTALHPFEYAAFLTAEALRTALPRRPRMAESGAAQRRR
jgi:hypothetical protein